MNVVKRCALKFVESDGLEIMISVGVAIGVAVLLAHVRPPSWL